MPKAGSRLRRLTAKPVCSIRNTGRLWHSFYTLKLFKTYRIMEEELNFQGKWISWREKLQKEHPQLTEEDLHYEAGKEADLVLRLGRKLGKTKEEIRNWLHIMG